MAATRVYGLWLCGAAGKRLRGYSGSLQTLRVSDELFLRMVFLDSCDPQRVSPDEQQRSLKDIMVTDHLAFSERVVGLAFIKRTGRTYQSRIDKLTPQQRVASPGIQNGHAELGLADVSTSTVCCSTSRTPAP